MAEASRLSFHPGTPVDRTVSRDGVAVLTGPDLAAVIAERMRQVDQHGYTIERDQRTAEPLDLVSAGVAYANVALDQIAGIRRAADATRPDPNWPWSPGAWSPDDTPRANLAKAAALIWAAIDYIDNRRAAAGVQGQAA